MVQEIETTNTVCMANFIIYRKGQFTPLAISLIFIWIFRNLLNIESKAQVPGQFWHIQCII